jgi:hypothetical protein
VDDLGNALHAAMCADGFPEKCSRYTEGSRHHEYYENQARELHTLLDDVIGSANVKPVVLCVIEELL